MNGQGAQSEHCCGPCTQAPQKGDRNGPADAEKQELRPSTRDNASPHTNTRLSASLSNIQSTLFTPTASSLRVLLRELHLLGCSSSWASFIIPTSSLHKHTRPSLLRVGLAPTQRCHSQGHVQQMSHSLGDKPGETRATWFENGSSSNMHARAQPLCTPLYILERRSWQSVSHVATMEQTQKWK